MRVLDCLFKSISILLVLMAAIPFACFALTLGLLIGAVNKIAALWAVKV